MSLAFCGSSLLRHPREPLVVTDVFCALLYVASIHNICDHIICHTSTNLYIYIATQFGLLTSKGAQDLSYLSEHQAIPTFTIFYMQTTVLQKSTFISTCTRMYSS